MTQDRDQNKVNLRLPGGLRDKVRARAAVSRRSMNAEFVKLIEDRIEWLDSYEAFNRKISELRGGVDDDGSAALAQLRDRIEKGGANLGD